MIILEKEKYESNCLGDISRVFGLIYASNRVNKVILVLDYGY